MVGFLVMVLLQFFSDSDRK